DKLVTGVQTCALPIWAYLVYPGPRPRWLGESTEELLTKVELGPRRRPAGVGELYGVNLSFRKDWLLRAGGFRTDIGRIGTTLFEIGRASCREKSCVPG